MKFMSSDEAYAAFDLYRGGRATGTEESEKVT